MEEDVAERGKAADRGRVEADRVEVAWAVPLRDALAELASVRSVGTVNRMNVECPVCRSSARSVRLQWSGSDGKRKEA